MPPRHAAAKTSVTLNRGSSADETSVVRRQVMGCGDVEYCLIPTIPACHTALKHPVGRMTRRNGRNETVEGVGGREGVARYLSS